MDRRIFAAWSVFGCLMAMLILGCGAAPEEQTAEDGGDGVEATAPAEDHGVVAVEPAEVEVPREKIAAVEAAPEEMSAAPMMMRSTAEPAPTASPRMMRAPASMGARTPIEMAAEEAEAAMAAPNAAMAPMMAAESVPDDTPGYEVVEVLYGTDRELASGAGIVGHFYPAIGLAFGGLALFGLMWKYQMVRVGGVLAIVAVALGLFVARDAGLDYQKELRALASGSAMFSGGRGELQFGACHVSIPEVHEVGQLEAPSILKLELTERPEKHVVLLDVLSKEEEAFFADLREMVAQSPRREILIFVHGYNVSFEDAARRTAQMAYDLKFTGVPMFYSWPSQADLFGYATDRDNSLWTVSHLKEFLLKVAQQSDAQSINLIAHSMGNRAMGAALEEIAAEMKEETKLFNQVVLAAPDVDAQVFKEEIAPQIVRASNQVTLYASANDLALLASKNVNGYPRAGDVRPEIVIVPGVDTIDVSAIDTSLIGHAYYGDNDSIICDIFTLLHQPQPAAHRQWLRSVSGPGGMYWVFEPSGAGVANAGGAVSR
ncbi:alpha/beta hydrolase [Blastopirellula sp. JC732]|uniref:Alpha/beta hydrolase n=1 Tax=Blastopirellula sediminis TaxID=2894196 RepID=A0A9X1MN78_9BACT|nr:alpha/beta hydrolase [Blastopirellula sediminis]MCC9609743.1 alpha/beta hydrolase [Blastopirellula sediminis]MCC9628987.1 alpha/beta hydrolase [Blastopirellula sediminis]